MLKWMGGATAAAVLALGSLVFAGQALEAQEPEPDPQLWLEAEDVLAQDNAQASPPTFAPPAAAVTPPPPAPPAPPVALARQQAEDPFVIRRVLPITGPIRYGEWHWDEEGVGPGPLVVTVDLEARVISVFRGGYEIGAAAVLLGTDDHPTPLGVFPILTKERHNVSEKYNNAPMPYTLRLTWDGVAIHGSEVENGYASHGCVGVPEDFAARLFAIARKGDKVIITRGQKAGIGTPLAG